ATVVIGGLISSTLLTLLMLPALYYLFYRRKYAVRILPMLLFFLSAALPAQSQSFDSFEAVYDYALAHHPQLQNQDLSVNQITLKKEAVGQWDPLTLNYQGGQINYAGFDHFFSVNQDISNLFGNQARKNAIDREAGVASFDKLLLANELKFSLKKAYDHWAYEQAQLLLTDSIRSIYESLQPMVDLRQELGETGGMEGALYRNQLLNYQQAYLLQQQVVEAAAFLIRELAYLPQDAVLKAPVYALLPVDTFTLKPESSLYAQTFELKRDLLQAQLVQVEKEARLPSVQIGYFMQSLEKDLGFQGISLGLGIPLDRRQLKTQRQQYQLENLKLENEQQGLIAQYDTRIRALEKQLELLQEYLQQYRQGT
ncbi:MAG: hypothetical protein KDC44_23030, partial [Phaeodactylibacter sp.]|nr:hypothetical protein [Phaeodactylibacter sp.]